MTQIGKVESTANQTERYIRIARSTKKYIETNFHHPIHLVDLSQHIGISIRMVQRCFKAQFDTTVTDSLKDLRLNAANRELLAENPGKTSVKQVALRNGFTHFGRFSVAYRQRFGESPSETLTATPGSKTRAPASAQAVNL